MSASVSKIGHIVLKVEDLDSALHLRPDGNLIELYVDADETLWRHAPSLVANSDPLKL